MELLGPSVQDLFEYSGHKFTLGIVLSVGQQMVSLSCHGGR